MYPIFKRIYKDNNEIYQKSFLCVFKVHDSYFRLIFGLVNSKVKNSCHVGELLFVNQKFFKLIFR